MGFYPTPRKRGSFYNKMQFIVTIILSCRFPAPCRQGIENAGACHFSKAFLLLICFSHADRKPLRFSTMGGWLSFHLPAVFDTIWFYFRSIRKSKDFKYKARCSFSLNRLFSLPVLQLKPWLHLLYGLIQDIL